jgi:hypothetical protein
MNRKRMVLQQSMTGWFAIGTKRKEYSSMTWITLTAHCLISRVLQPYFYNTAHGACHFNIGRFRKRYNSHFFSYKIKNYKLSSNIGLIIYFYIQTLRF